MGYRRSMTKKRKKTKRGRSRYRKSSNLSIFSAGDGVPSAFSVRKKGKGIAFR